MRWLRANIRRQADWRAIVQVALMLVLWLVLWSSLPGGYDQLMLSNSLTNVMLALGLFLILRAGRMSLAQATLSGVGAYVAAYLDVNLHVNPLVALIPAALAAALVGGLVGLLALRLEGFYFVIATLALSQLFIVVVDSWQSVTGGSNGIFGVPRLSSSTGGLFDFSWGGGYMGYALLLLILSTVSYAVVGILTGKTGVGRTITAIGADEVLASSLGVAVTKWRIVAFMVGSLIAGLAGAVQASYLGLAAPSTYSLYESVLVVAMVFLGGRNSLVGVVLGAFALTYIPQWFNFGAQTQLVFLGGFFVVITVLLPGGLVPSVGAATRRVLYRRKALNDAVSRLSKEVTEV